MSSGGRPYRSRLQPACLACKKRKTRCKIDDSSASCEMCKFHATRCIFPDLRGDVCRTIPSSGISKRRKPRSLTSSDKNYESQMNTSSPGGRMPFEKLRGQMPAPNSDVLSVPQKIDHTPSGVGTSLSHPSHIAYAEGEDDNVHVVGPVMASDKEVLETYFSTTDRPRPFRTAIQTSSNGTIRPIQFTTVPRRALGVNKSHNPAATNRRIIEKIIEPLESELIQLYFQSANLCMPLFERSLFLDTYTEHKENLSPALLSNLYANAIVYWYTSPILSLQRRPDVRFIWNQANEALHSELFISPGVSTLIALLLNSGGRPSTSPVSNGGYVGNAVALANGLGLNRDPSTWEIPQAEKDLRVKIWWFLIIQDRWSSFSYGTPPHISLAHYDVPAPRVESLLQRESSDSELAAASIFISLFNLTEILGRLLDHIYDLRKGISQEGSIRSSDSLYSRLNAWKSSLKGLAYSIIVDGIVPEVPGAANFRLAYLATELLLCRIQLDLDKQQQSGAQERSPISHHQLHAFRVAEDIVLQVQSLRESDLRGYWLPATTVTLTSTITFLLRNAIRSRTSGDMRDDHRALERAIDLIVALRSHLQKYEWDIAEGCIEQYGELVDKMAALNDPDQTTGLEETDFQSMLQPEMADFLSQAVDFGGIGMDIPFLDLWNTQGAMSFS